MEAATFVGVGEIYEYPPHIALDGPYSEPHSDVVELELELRAWHVLAAVDALLLLFSVSAALLAASWRPGRKVMSIAATQDAARHSFAPGGGPDEEGGDDSGWKLVSFRGGGDQIRPACVHSRSMRARAMRRLRVQDRGHRPSRGR